MIFVVNFTAAALLFPMADGHEIPEQQHYIIICFSALMLASLGSGCVAAFLKERAGASVHIRSACGYATVNWLQSILACMSFHPDFFTYGIVSLDVDTWYSWYYLIVCRGLAYLFASLWMQKLIASRLDLLEQSSNSKFGGGCIRCLLRVQTCTASLAAIQFCIVVFAYVTKIFSSAGLMNIALALAGLTLFWNVVASMVAICSFSRSFLMLRKVLGKDVPVVAKSSLGQAQRLAALQTLGICFSLVLTIVVVPFIVACNAGEYLGKRIRRLQLDYVGASVQALDVLGNGLAVLLLSGSHRLPKLDRAPEQRLCCCACPRQTRALPEKERGWSPTWREKVEELSLRGMTLRSLLRFYQEELLPMPGWKYVPKEHKTKDVVRRAIIPLTSREESAYAVSALNKDGPQRARVMVTHNWGNCFKDCFQEILSRGVACCLFT